MGRCVEYVGRRNSLALKNPPIVAALGCGNGEGHRDRNLSSDCGACGGHTGGLEIADFCKCRDCRRIVDIQSWDINVLSMWV